MTEHQTWQLGQFLYLAIKVNYLLTNVAGIRLWTSSSNKYYIIEFFELSELLHIKMSNSAVKILLTFIRTRPKVHLVLLFQSVLKCVFEMLYFNTFLQVSPPFFTPLLLPFRQSRDAFTSKTKKCLEFFPSLCIDIRYSKGA